MSRAKKLSFLLMLLTSPALAQQLPDLAKLAPLYRQQRDMANDSVAVCAVTVSDLQARIVELEKRLAEVQKPAEGR